MALLQIRFFRALQQLPLLKATQGTYSILQQQGFQFLCEVAAGISATISSSKADCVSKRCRIKSGIDQHIILVLLLVNMLIFVIFSQY